MTPAGVELIRFFEGLRLETYLDVAGNLDTGQGVAYTETADETFTELHQTGRKQ
jgi:GH24 family phage-related lysozyme (muramidase)